MTFPIIIRIVFVVQLLCAAVFLFDFLVSVIRLPPGFNIPWQVLEVIQILAVIGFLAGVLITLWVLRQSMQRNVHVENQLMLASGEFNRLLDLKFEEWGLTPAERDVALLTIKGLTLSEIAEMRQTSEGTIKAQTAAIYRKSGLSGRAQLVSSFVEDLIDMAEIKQAT